MLGVVIPAYKRKDCLRDALNSLVNQTYKKFFVIVVDDHSPEPLESIVNEFQDKLNIRYIYAEQNGGPGAARQLGLERCYKAGFDLVMFMDSDDLLFPQAISRLTYEINHTQANVVSAGIWVEQNNSTGSCIGSNNRTWLHGKIYRTAFLQKYNIDFPPIRTNEDLGFNLAAMLATEKVGCLEEILYLFRDEQNSITRSGEFERQVYGGDFIDGIYYAAKKLLEIRELPEQIYTDIINCYNFSQQTKILCQPLSEEQEKHLRWMINLPGFQERVRDQSWLRRRLDIPNHFWIHNKKIYYFTQTFKDWLEEYTDGNSNN